MLNDDSNLAVKAYYDLANEHNIDPIHMALSFCKERPFMGSVIFGATSIVPPLTVSLIYRQESKSLRISDPKSM